MDESSPLNSMEADKGFNRLRFRLSLSSAILAGMILGIITGIFFGDLVSFMEIIGNGFIKLLQMTILPL